MAEDAFTNALKSILDSFDKTQHDAITRASANSYTADKLNPLGLQIDVNIDSKKRFVGEASNPLYPDIVVWKPDFPSSSKGKAVIIEKIETAKSIEINWQTWKRFADVGIVFVLIVPLSQVENAKRKLDLLGIRAKTKLQYFEYNTTTKVYSFHNVT